MNDAQKQVWILIIGRFISQIGTGFTLFYASIFFVNQVGLSATAVGIGLGSASISGVAGRILSGSMCDSPNWGRKRTLLLSAILSAAGSFVLAATQDFATLVAGNLLNGMGVGLYWPASETVVADLTPPDKRRETYALNRLADSLGLEFGIILGGAWIARTDNYRLLFVLDGVSYLLFFTVLAIAIVETGRQIEKSENPFKNWAIALRDRTLLVYVAVNVLFTTYISQTDTALPVYLSNFLSVDDGNGFPPNVLSGLFTWHVAVSVLLQLPVAKLLGRFNHARALTVSAVLWALSFVGVWTTGNTERPLVWAVITLGVMAIATVSYTPSASALVVELAPDNLRGVYLSINSLCWAVGYAVGPPLGGFALDRTEAFAHGFWLVLAASIAIVIATLQQLDRLLAKREARREAEEMG
ncbi:MDR family MFS transporter [Baaleninema simplex]|uniref:MDR family MFS transporter n=1 Tax=Baaleninema simplex TaxID=2862350 RepID=UPI0003494A5C|nr:MFS transporter [Baaleninema simplex]